MWKETYICEKRPKKTNNKPRPRIDRCSVVALKTYICERRPIYVKRDLYMWKETYICEKRPVYVKRDLYMWKETYICEKKHVYRKIDLYMSGALLSHKSVCMCVYIHIYIYTYIYIYMHESKYWGLLSMFRINMSLCVNASVYLCNFKDVRVCVCVYMHNCIYVCIHTHLSI